MNPPRHHSKASLVFFIDVDDTIFNDGRVLADLRHHVRSELGPRGGHRYWQILQRLQRVLGYADYLGALQQYRRSYPHDPHILTVSSFLINYPFDKCVLPHARRLLKRCGRLGSVVILSDGDVVFQPHKIERAGFAEAVDDHVLIYVHKEEQLQDIELCYPADHYVVIDDNRRILSVIKRKWKSKVTTVWVAQSCNGSHRGGVRGHPKPDLTVQSIQDLKKKDLRALARLHTISPNDRSAAQ